MFQAHMFFEFTQLAENSLPFLWSIWMEKRNHYRIWIVLRWGLMLLVMAASNAQHNYSHHLLALSASPGAACSVLHNWGLVIASHLKKQVAGHSWFAMRNLSAARTGWVPLAALAGVTVGWKDFFLYQNALFLYINLGFRVWCILFEV